MLTTRHNQFLGINPHLHSQLQQNGQWDVFHANHIVDLARSIQGAVRPLGYLAQVEQSLQIRRPDGAPTPLPTLPLVEAQRQWDARSDLTT